MAALKERRGRALIVAAFVNEVRARTADLRRLLEAIEDGGAEAPRCLRAGLRQVAMLERAAEGIASVVPPAPAPLHDLDAARIDRALRAAVVEAGDDAGSVKPCRVILADLEQEAVTMMTRLARVAIACRFPWDPAARGALLGAAAVFLPGESGSAADRAVRDRIEAVTDAGAELAEAVKQGTIRALSRA